MDWLIGVDVGGTFTDFFAYNASARSFRLFKRPSTPHNPAAAIVEGVREIQREFGINGTSVSRLCHGTTVATNSLIQRKGGSVAVITTRGFRDLLEIGRQTRPHLYSLQLDHPAPLAPRQLRFEVNERITSGPRVVTRLDHQSVDEAVAAVKKSGVDACAVCLLFSFLDGSHERHIGKVLAKASPNVLVSLSSEVQPEFREYERFSTAVLNAYLQPVMERYLSFLEGELAEEMPQAKIGIYQSSGGLMSIDTARRLPVRTALSGPAAGAVGAIHSARESKRPNVITLDMGGTSADVALIRDYQASLSFDRAVAGFPVRLPMVDIHTVGAGGGSIAWFDRDDLLKVGPASAGADPGPACYGKGGTDITVTDANLLLGRLSSKGLIGGRMPLDVEASRRAIAPVADRLGYPIERTALGIIDIVIANMVRAIRTVSVERGHDPRQYCLLPFGGAGPLHASQVARALGISQILVPAAPGILCAQGLIASELKEDFVRSVRLKIDSTRQVEVGDHLAGLAKDATAWFTKEETKLAAQKVRLSFDMRYVGQNFELPVMVGAANGAKLPKGLSAKKLKEKFFAVHDQFYGFHSESDAVEIVNIRLTASAAITHLAWTKVSKHKVRPPNPSERRQVWFEASKSIPTPVYNRSELHPGQKISGPAVVEQFDSTTLLYPSDRLEVDKARNIIVRLT